MFSRLITCTLLFVVVPHCVGNHCITAPPSPSPSRNPSTSPSPPPKPWYYGRYFYFSNRAPIIETLKNVDGFMENVDETLTMLEQIEYRILREQEARSKASERISRMRRGSSESRKPFGSPSIPLCNLEDLEWRKAAKSMFQATFNQTTSIKCVTDFIPRGEKEDLLHNLVAKYRRYIDEHAADINKEAKSMFSRPDTVLDYPYSTTTEDCQFNAIAANRQKTDWYLNVAITNKNRDRHLGDYQRKFLVEYVGRGGSHANMTLRLKPSHSRPVGENEYRSDASTLLAYHHGPASPNFFKHTFLEDNVAVIRALEKSRFHSEQVSDALSASSISILVLPLFLNALPIALFADVSARTMLLYAILSDVLTTIPLLIKGIELITIGSRSSIAAITRITSGFDGTLVDVAAAEVFVANCRSKKNVLPTGIVFVGISLAFLIVGLAAEILAREYVAYKRRKLI